MPSPLIRRADQAVLATLAALSLAGMAAWWARSGAWSGGLVDIDAAAPLDQRFLVDVNRAEWPELAQLPGVGPAIARRIVASRAADGDFRTVGDLDRVEGIGPRRLETIRRYLLPLPEDAHVAGGASGAPSG